MRSDSDYTAERATRSSNSLGGITQGDAKDDGEGVGGHGPGAQGRRCQRWPGT
jgi:hypothetical protein